MSQTAEVVVVGGGVNGASIAYALAAKGVKVVLRREGGSRGRRFRPLERAGTHALHE